MQLSGQEQAGAKAFVFTSRTVDFPAASQ